MNQPLTALGAAAALIATVALIRRSIRGGAGDDHTTAAGRTYGARPEADDGGPELDRPVWHDDLDLDIAWDEELPRGIAPRRPTPDTEDTP